MTDHSKQTANKDISFNLIKLKEEVYEELTQDILPFWSEKMKDTENGGYFGQMTGKNQLVKNAPRGGILNARILWTFSSAAFHLKNEAYLKEAEHAKEYIFNHFFDEEFGGTYWMLNADGSPTDTKKQIYSQAFFIYALVEFYRTTGNAMALEKAKELFSLIEKYSFDKDKNGYFEAYSRDWLLLDDVRLSDKDANEKKTMNTHLHLLEAYTHLFRVWKNPLLEMQLKNLIDLFLDKIINSETYHLNLFFDENWVCKSFIQSFGHDIEASWLLDEAATVLGDGETLQKVRNVVLRVADAAAEGFREDGGLMNEKNVVTNYLDTNSDWWPQAEAVVGFFNAFQLSKKESYLKKVFNSWNFIKENLIDKENGEWYWSVSKDRHKDILNDKAGFWKCPYHNSRMCIELINRIK
jgi:mannobiose 2-epimerase